MLSKSKIAVIGALLLGGASAALAANTYVQGSARVQGNGGSTYSTEFTPEYESAMDAYAMQRSSVKPFTSIEQSQFNRQSGIDSER
jgi:hypothetical protein